MISAVGPEFVIAANDILYFTGHLHCSKPFVNPCDRCDGWTSESSRDICLACCH